MQRRHLLLAALTPLTASLSACGGGDDEGPDSHYQPEPTDAADPGVEPASLSSLPRPQALPTAYLLEVVRTGCEIEVMLGSEFQAHCAVRLFDCEDRLLGAGTADARGRCTFDLPVPRYVRAEADTAHGLLQGYDTLDETSVTNLVPVDMLHTLSLLVADRLDAPFNVVRYAMHDYFALGDGGVENYGPDDPRMSQLQMAETWRASGLALSAWLGQLADELVEHVDHDSQTDLRFKHAPDEEKAQLARPPLDDLVPMDLVDPLVNEVIKMISGAIPVPFASKLASLLLAKGWKSLSQGDRKTVSAVDIGIQQIQQGIRTMLTQQNQTEVLSHMLKLSSRYDAFVTYRKTLADMRAQLDAGKRSDEDYELGVQIENTRLLTGENIVQLKSAARQFLGCDNYDGISTLASINKLISTTKFYGNPSQSLYLRYLDFFLLQHTAAYADYVSVTIADGKAKGLPESFISAELDRIHTELQRVKALVDKVRVPRLPARVAIDHANKTAWVGSCHDWSSFRDFFTRDTVVASEPRRIEGTGFDLHLLMHTRTTGDNGVNQAAINFGKWQHPTVDQLKASFLNDAKKYGEKVDACARANGIGMAVPFTRQGTGTVQAVVIRQDNKSRYKKNGFYYNNGAKVTLVKLANLSTENNHWIMSCLYENCWEDPKKTFAFFPVVEITDDQLKTYLPWLRQSAVSGCSV